jgi:hypothetical protein
MKDLAKKFVNVMGQGAMRPKQADKLLAFVIDGISFAFSDKDNFAILDGLVVFLQKNYLSPNQMKELYERVSRDAETIENKIKQLHDGDINVIIYPIKHFLYNVSKVVGVARQPPVAPSEKTKKQIIKLREQLYKNKENESKAIKKSAVRIDETKTTVEAQDETLIVHQEIPELPLKRTSDTNEEPVKKSIKKSSILHDTPPVTAKKSGIILEDILSEPYSKKSQDKDKNSPVLSEVTSIATNLTGDCKPAIKKSSLKPVIKKSSIRLDPHPEIPENPEILLEQPAIPVLVRKY